jgi:uncharacterized protein
MNRRTFLRAAALSAIPATIGTAAYGLFEAANVEVARVDLAVPKLPVPFEGTTVAFLADVHHGPFTNLEYVAGVVRTTLALRPDLIVLGGDYSLKHEKYIRPCFEVLAALRAPLGVFGVLGNHDYWHGIESSLAGFERSGIAQLTNRGAWLERAGYRVRLAGVDDLWTGRANVSAALGDATAEDACVLVSHNPDLAETLTDARVGVMLSGHTHGGQVVFPGGGAPFVPSRYGSKYLKGLVRAPHTSVYVSRGLGCSGVPVRFASRPELTLFTLKSA